MARSKPAKVTEESPDTPRLRPRARLMMTLGLELISSETVALTELVKNAFDADARFVLVRVTGDVDHEGVIQPEGACLEILDDGHGMDVDTIRATWLEPATPNRRKAQASPGGRRVLGEKGVGRFAAAKLGPELEMVSRFKGRDEVKVAVDWSAFEDEDAYLDQIEVKVEERKPTEFMSGGPISRTWRSIGRRHLDQGEAGPKQAGPRTTQGTLLRITGLRMPWTPDTIRDLERSLSRLISPFAHDEQIAPDFQIVLDLPESFGIASGLVNPPEELQRSHYHLEVEVDGDGTAVGSMTLKGESRTINTELVNADDETPLRCGPFELRLSVWDRDVESLRTMAADGAKTADVRALLDSAAGVSVYRDGFRVLPYGERGDDWLGLDLRRVQSPTKRLSNNQLVGYVLIGRDRNPQLIDQTNREGMIESPAYDDLRHAVRQLLLLLENERYELRPRQERTKRGGLLDRIDLTDLKNEISAKLPHDDRIVTMVTSLQAELDDRNDKIGEVLSRYHRLATLGQLIDRVVHELGQPIVSIRQALVLGRERISDEVTGSGDECAEVLGDLDAQFAIIDRQSRAANDVVRRIAPFGGRRRGRPREFPVEAAIADAVALLKEDIDSVGVRVELPTSSTTVSVDGTELQEVLVNLLTNSLYWLRRVKKNRRAIAFAVERNNDGSLSIIVEDSGPGVPEPDHSSIFDPYFTTREGGVGLGLSIAGEIVSDYYGGELELLPPGTLGGARFRATLRRRVG